VRYKTLGWKGLPGTHPLGYSNLFCKLQWKQSVVNTAPRVIITTLHFLCTLLMGTLSLSVYPRQAFSA
jgi:hypothetical protein